MATPNYDINYDDKRFTKVESDKKAAINEVDKTYGNMISQSDSFYNSQINASKQWADKQTQLQQDRTDFALEKIEQQKAQAKKDYTKEQSGAYVDWQKQSNQFGAEAEQMAAQGMTGTGYSESSQVSMYNQYQNRVATAREAYVLIVQNYDNNMTEARLQNSSALAEIAYQAQKDQLELALQGFQYKNSLIIEQANKKMELENQYYARYQDVLKQINTENALAEEVRQYNETMAEEKRQYNSTLKMQQAQLAEEQRQFNAQMAYQKAKDAAAASAKVSGGGGGGGSSSSRKTRVSKGDKSEKVKSGSVSKTSSAKASSKSTKSSSPEIDMQSVLALGMGPISASKLNSLVEQGIVREYVSGGKTKFAYTASGFKQKQLYSRMG